MAMNPESAANAAMICGTLSSCTLHWFNSNSGAVVAMAAAISCLITVAGFIVNLYYKRNPRERRYKS